MDLKADLKWIHQELDNVKDPKFIERIKKMLKNRNTISSKHISIEQYNKEIEEAEIEIENGKFYTQKEVVKMTKEWGR